MKSYCWIISLVGLLSSASFALGDYRAMALEAKNQASHQIAVYQHDAEMAKKRQKEILVDYAQSNPNVNSKNDLSAQAVRATPKSSILIFVSFSMPRKSLEAYLRDAKKVHASVVIRGLVDNSMQKTFQHIAELVKESGGEGIELNPLWFNRFDIQTVPAVVVVRQGSACFSQTICNKETDFDVMRGDITLSAALRVIRDKGRVTRDIAQLALDKLQDVSHA